METVMNSESADLCSRNAMQDWCNLGDFCRAKPRLHSTEAEFGTGGWQCLLTSQHIFPPGLS